LPVLPGPLLLAETAASFEIVTDCPAVREILPPEPEPRSVPIVRLKTPAGEPSPCTSDNEIWFVASMLMLPPCPVLLVVESIVEPLPRVSEVVLIDICPASP